MNPAGIFKKSFADVYVKLKKSKYEKKKKFLSRFFICDKIGTEIVSLFKIIIIFFSIKKKKRQFLLVKERFILKTLQ